MMKKTSILSVFVVLAALIPPTRVMAQQSDAAWMDNCQRDGGEGWQRRETFCEIRTATARPSGGTVSMEGLRNGGVSGSKWDGSGLDARTTNGPLTLRRK